VASTVWKGQLTFGLVTFPVRLVRAARKDRIPLRYVREVAEQPAEPRGGASRFPQPAPEDDEQSTFEDSSDPGTKGVNTFVAPVRQAYLPADDDNPVLPQQLQRGYEITPGQFAVVRAAELRRLRQPTSSAMAILRSVRMDEIDPVFLETSYYVLPGDGGEHPYGLFYRALKESNYATLAEVAMHGRQHVIVIRPGHKGLIAHTMYYVNEVRGAEEHAAETKDVSAKEIDLARRFVQAIAEPFRPEEFTDRYREQLEALIAAKETVPAQGSQESPRSAAGKVIDIMDALRKSLENATAQKAARKPAAADARSARPRKRRA